MSTTTSVQSKIPPGRGASRHLATILRKRLDSGEFGPGDRLPTDRKLMEEFGIGYGVANRAMGILAREGLIERQQGQGTFVSQEAPGIQRDSRSDEIALVLGHSSWSFNLSLVRGADEEDDAGRLHHRTIICETDNDVHLQASKLIQLIASRVSGIALVPTTEAKTPDCHIAACQNSGIPVVLLHRGVKGASAPLIAMPYEEIGYRLVKALTKQGHRRVACVFDEHYVATEQYEAGLRRAMAECNNDEHALTVFCSGKRSIPITPEYEKYLGGILEKILALPLEKRPTAIVAIADDAAYWIYLHLMRLGVSVPEQMSLITVGSTIRLREIDRQLAAVTVDEVGVGRLARQLLTEMDGGKRPINDTEQFAAELEFHAGRTLGPASQATEPTVPEKAAEDGK